MGIPSLGQMPSGVTSTGTSTSGDFSLPAETVFVRTPSGRGYRAEQINSEEGESTGCWTAVRHCLQGFCSAIRRCFGRAHCGSTHQSYQVEEAGRASSVDWESVRRASVALGNSMRLAREQGGSAPQNTDPSHAQGSRRPSSLSGMGEGEYNMETAEQVGCSNCSASIAARLRQWCGAIRGFFGNCCSGQASSRESSGEARAKGQESSSKGSEAGGTSTNGEGDSDSLCSIEAAGPYANEYLWAEH